MFRIVFCIILAVTLIACADDIAQKDTAADAQEKCETLTHNEKAYFICRFNADIDDIRLFHSNSEGALYRQFETLARSLQEQNERLVFAMNGGMYHDDRRPVGYYRDSYGPQSVVNTNEGPGNFHLLPNGVFWLKDGRAGITESQDYLDLQLSPDFATQSGPLLVIDGKLHPQINPQGTSLKRRNGVGVGPYGKEVILVISDTAVNFHNFATLFRDRLNTPNALFLDGQVSRVFAPTYKRYEPGSDLGPIIGVVRKGSQK